MAFYIWKKKPKILNNNLKFFFKSNKQPYKNFYV